MSQRPPLPMSQSSRQKQHPLDTLQSMINAVLIETGKALRSANKKGVKSIGHDNERLQAFIPSAIDKFHLALDELESDILRAKAVLNRDLLELRAKQYELDHPNILPMDDLGGLDVQNDMAVPRSQVMPLSQTVEAIESAKEVEIPGQTQQNFNSTSTAIKTEVDVTPFPTGLEFQYDDESPEKLQKQIEDNGRQDRNDGEISGGQVVTGPGIENSDMAFSGSHPSAELQSMSFESIFDTSGGHNDPELNFDDLDFGAGGTGDHSHEFGHADGELDLSSFGNQVHANNDDVGALLQGLGNYADASGGTDFTMIDMSNNAGNNANIEHGGVSDDYGMSGADLDIAMGMGANESNFDDLLDGMDFGDGDDGTGGDMMEHGEFDDAFFGIS